LSKLQYLFQPDNANYNNSLIAGSIENILEYNNMHVKYQILYVIKFLNVKVIV
jgi:hypothetical protein